MNEDYSWPRIQWALTELGQTCEWVYQHTTPERHITPSIKTCEQGGESEDLGLT